MAKCYQYTADGYFAGEAEDYGLLPNNATYTVPPAGPWERVWPRCVDDVWEMVEDHRERAEPYFALEYTQDATPYWMPADGDDWQSQPRTMRDPGPLPEGHRLTRPQKPLAMAKVAKAQEITSAHGAVLSYLLAESPSPTPVEAALAVEDMRSDDPDGLSYVRGLADSRRTDLLAQVEAVSVAPVDDPADTDAQEAAIAAAVAEVEAIVVAYPV